MHVAIGIAALRWRSRSDCAIVLVGGGHPRQGGRPSCCTSGPASFSGSSVHSRSFSCGGSRLGDDDLLLHLTSSLRRSASESHALRRNSAHGATQFDDIHMGHSRDTHRRERGAGGSVDLAGQHPDRRSHRRCGRRSLGALRPVASTTPPFPLTARTTTTTSATLTGAGRLPGSRESQAGSLTSAGRGSQPARTAWFGLCVPGAPYVLGTVGNARDALEHNAHVRRSFALRLLLSSGASVLTLRLPWPHISIVPYVVRNRAMDDGAGPLRTIWSGRVYAAERQRMTELEPVPAYR